MRSICSTSGGATCVSLGEFQAWLNGIGVYASDPDWSKHKVDHEFDLFYKIWPGIEPHTSKVFEVKTDNPMLFAHTGENFDGSIIDLLNLRIIEIKAIKAKV